MLTYRTGTRDEAIVAITMTNAGAGEHLRDQPSPTQRSGTRSIHWFDFRDPEPEPVTYGVHHLGEQHRGFRSLIRLNITVNEPLADLTAQPEDSTHTLGVAITPVTFANAGGVVDVWAIDPALPSGLEMDEYTGTISGTPTVNQTSAVTYTVYANNSGGAHSISINLTINDPVASIIPSLENTTGTEDVAITDITFSVTGSSRAGRSSRPYLRTQHRWDHRTHQWCAGREPHEDLLHRVCQQHGRLDDGGDQHHDQRTTCRARWIRPL